MKLAGKKLIFNLLLIFILIPLNSFKIGGQNPVKEKPYMIVAQMPQFPGGKHALNRYIRENLTYPFEALKHNIQGKVNVEFVVAKDGTLTEIRTVGTKLGYGLEEQAVKIFQKMPKWIPGKQDGIAVPVYMMLPIVFSI
ncbi:MAG: energy transducer TonB [Bacteroidetes bacterium]|nr:energy transducer TonB [Bacteroidota bacterium]